MKIVFNRRSGFACLMLTSLLACNNDNGVSATLATDEGTEATSAVTSASSSAGSSSSTSTSLTDASGSAGESNGEMSSTSAGPSSTSSSGEPMLTTGAATTGAATTGTSTSGGGDPVSCEGMIYECGDGQDNDGDGKFDAADPECTGPCDNDEGSFQTGIPGDNVDCFQDCFFDGNSGSGDDMCNWNLKCDPENPGAGGLCEYMPTPMCNMMPLHDTPEACEEFCEPLTPNGCDCFGCCTLDIDGEEISIYLNGDPDCSLDNLDACTTCTPSEICNNPCEPDECEICIGEVEVPEGCTEPGCPDGVQSCLVDEQGESDCPEGYYCLTGCCYMVIE